jgi:hypothetical protein
LLRQAAAALIVHAPLEKLFALWAWTVWVRVRVPNTAAAAALFAMALAAAADAAEDTLAPELSGGDEHPIECRQSAAD